MTLQKNKKTLPDKKTAKSQASSPNKSIPFPNGPQIYKLSLLGLLMVATFVLYRPTLHYPFQFDDKPNIVQNENIRLAEINWLHLKKAFYGTSGRNRPVTMLSFALNYYFGRYTPFGYRLINILIHVVNGILLYFFLKLTIVVSNAPDKDVNPFLRIPRLNDSISNPLFLLPYFTAAFWLLHPLATNSVTYIIQRMNSMMTMFYLLAMVCYIKTRKDQISDSNRFGFKSLFGFTCSGIAALLSLACKETAAILPVMIFIYDYYFFQNLNQKWLINNTTWRIGSAVVAVFALVLANRLPTILHYFNLYKQLEFGMWERLMTEFRVVLYYVTLILFPRPSNLNIDHDITISSSLINPLSTLGALAVIAGLLIYAIYAAKKERVVSFGILWYFGNLIIESTILPLDLIFEHRIYLASIMPLFLLVCFVFYIFKRAKLIIVILSACSVILAYWTFDRNRVWQNEIALWTDSTAKSPNKSRPHVNLGENYAAQGDFRKAIIEYQKALAINPHSDYTHYNLGTAYYGEKEITKAIHHYRLALKINPDSAEAHNNLGVALIDLKQVEEGIKHYKEALRLKPNHPEAPSNLQKAQTGLDQINDRISEIEKKMQYQKNDPELLYRLGYLYYRKGKFQEAEYFYNRSLFIQPDFIKAMTALSILYAEQHKDPEAIDLLKKILLIQPDNSSIYYNLACIYARSNNQDTSMRWLQKAIDRGFSNWDLIENDNDLKAIRETHDYLQLRQAMKLKESVNVNGRK